jgi:lipid A 4'-phosphatase
MRGWHIAVALGLVMTTSKSGRTQGVPSEAITPLAPAAARSVFFRNYWLGLTLALLVAALAFTMFPQIDLRVSRAFYLSGEGFVGQRIGWLQTVRLAFLWFFWAYVGLTLAALVLTRLRRRKWLRLGFGQWVLVAVCLGVGPGLIANVALKNHWGRARPNQIVEFGGSNVFTPALVPARQCVSNCSFVSGEAASAFIPFYAMALAVPQGSAALVGLGTLVGLAAGLVRLAQGGHFASDIVFGGLLMALTAALARLCMDDGPMLWRWLGRGK